MLAALILIVLVLAVAGGVAVHPLFLLALLALLMFVSGRGHTVP
jgi:hypothetical protein